MQTLYFDCSSGISGNMTLAALTEIIGDENYLIDELKKLNIDGYDIEVTKAVKNGITGTHVEVLFGAENDKHHHSHEHSHGEEHIHSHEHSHAEEHTHGHEHCHGEEHIHSHEHCHGEEHTHSHEHSHGEGHTHIHRNLQDVNEIIDHSLLSNSVKDLSKRIFMRVAQAESKVHGKPLEEVHFHEVGAIDSIVDIIGTAILIDKIKPDRIVSSVVNDGHGFIHCAHGMMAVPVPATSEIFASSGVISRQIDIDTELVTPTGAAIIAELAESFELMPAGNVKKVAYGAGTKNLRIPNVLKVSLIETQDNSEDFVVMETNIDDTTGEILGYTMEQLFAAGALDAFYTPIFMKKNRPAYLLTVTCNKEDCDKLKAIIYSETTTIGIRYRYEHRTKLEREKIVVDTKYGKIEAKKVIFQDKEYIYPEYESVKKAAQEHEIPMKKIYNLEEFD